MKRRRRRVYRRPRHQRNSEATPDTPEEESPKAKFDQLYQDWQTLKANAEKNRADFENAKETDKEVIRAAYNATYEELQLLLPNSTRRQWKLSGKRNT